MPVLVHGLRAKDPRDRGLMAVSIGSGCQIRPTVREQSGGAPFILPFYSVQEPAHGVGLPKFRVGLPASIDFLFGNARAMQTWPKVCLLGDSKSSEVDIEDSHLLSFKGQLLIRESTPTHLFHTISLHNAFLTISAQLVALSERSVMTFFCLPIFGFSMAWYLQNSTRQRVRIPYHLPGFPSLEPFYVWQTPTLPRHRISCMSLIMVWVALPLTLPFGVVSEAVSPAVTANYLVLFYGVALVQYMHILDYFPVDDIRLIFLSFFFSFTKNKIT